MDILLAFYPVILLVLNFVRHCGAFLEDVCDHNDFECKHPNDITTMGHLQHRKSQQTNILRRIRQITLLKCVNECFMTSQCTAINYRKNWDLCDVVGEMINGTLVDEDGCIFSKISTWPKSLAGVCADHNCTAGRKCVKDGNGGVKCIAAYCETLLPDMYEAVSIETFGLYKNLGSGNKFKCNDGFELIGRPFAVCTDYGEWKVLFDCIEEENENILTFFIRLLKALYPPHDCADIPLRCGSGVYRIHPTRSAKFDVYCEMDTEDGGWTVIQRRVDGSTNFYKGWAAYENGFGNLTHEFWLGNAKIHKIVSTGDYQLRVDLGDFEGNTAWAKYTKFYVGDATTNYRLEINGYMTSSTAGDSLTYHNGNMFSTYDRDNDMHLQNCAVIYKGAWWYQRCHSSNLNGAYLSGIKSTPADGVIWYEWKGHLYSLKSTRLMIKKM
ncbi:Fibrinogen-like protein A,Ryncolin-4,Angiopoietin-related protein 7,Angiopoietin-related protein 1,Ficolin-3,Ficolin-1-B,Techylectin-5A,Ficolin-2,Ryncolin-1,Tenascin-R,Fibrinogen-like protein 1,Angiopoietin-related protein 4,Angiopoietin-1,Tenascin-X,Fibrinogen C domain-containing protein 1-A,Tenascin-N,Ryncolin-3,Tenascin,Fibroleukin,Fibrinogen C domain-containing protein 1,Fibrinogen gamma chain,Ryncolin-2,Angiopoietin-related protein 6,Techylectin-5B,Angiopoietin-related protein 2,Angiopoietin-2,Microfi|uniref:Fibrinogen C-terminal domain-containing protein n=1 Tax=Mytilus coruscus TaxID=42192 RepID=A0A6J8DCS1_MYTCO|nr:Fibrinogen-like protein A,Ryncolin-4,Angiopoietin-related protein 7,Angiopoietin-related protein 1,Ficolin-3,Ficolin-1-B,Techylectin-5A,Ficolin-2,Ryncolin-1,Tenascin-R,Fibrinogen-like protein 1,Angiopoietin-related protein 4,Angiopoietin-1,Tenascin-X,Fibrinogen C domain-containing protein 1-A,Tenascin-N,Ryncolin-3,Tenascin,Fibroleukin,Fibrinogen C domain-containing protein 1,Fibrinogen gamma chain,Ryncolin-2,Angiopoietin-related protein 6,Techylectin-5B,Angiopoietin-related protein 2,Angiopoieti